MKCKHCGNPSHSDDKYCQHCGNQLIKDSNSETYTSQETIPVQQAEKIIENVKKVYSRMSREEQIIALSTLAGIVSYLLPWFNSYSGSQNGFEVANINNRYYLVLLALIASGVLLYFGQGAKYRTKIFHMGVLIALGSFIFTSALALTGIELHAGVSVLLLSGVAIGGTALYNQKKLLSEH